jgi:hypothetical protein
VSLFLDLSVSVVRFNIAFRRVRNASGCRTTAAVSSNSNVSARINIRARREDLSDITCIQSIDADSCIHLVFVVSYLCHVM